MFEKYVPYELLDPLAALMSSSARHSAMVLMLRKAASRAYRKKELVQWTIMIKCAVKMLLCARDLSGDNLDIPPRVSLVVVWV